jgi:hypothetical protein
VVATIHFRILLVLLWCLETSEYCGTYGIYVRLCASCSDIFSALQYIYIFFIRLGGTAQGQLWPPEQFASILLYSEVGCLVSEQFSFYGVKSLASRPTLILEDQVIPLRLAPVP